MMKWLALAALVASACVGGEPRGDATPDASATDTGGVAIRLDGVAELRFGMSLDDAILVLGDSLRPQYVPYGDFPLCDYVYSVRLPGMAFMLRRDSIGGASRLERVDVSEPGVRTEAGITVGDSTALVAVAYPAAERRPHRNSPMVGAELFVIRSPDGAHLLIIETDGASVTSLRAGRRAAAEMGEGCA